MVKKGFLTGLLLFGIFFGAGNLIFPPNLGWLSGENFWTANIGFILSGVGIAMITLIIGTLNPRGYQAELEQKYSVWFANILLAVLYLTIGPLFAIPRTAATSFAIGLQPIFGDSSLALLIFTVLYFAAALAISLKPSKILDSVGKILTPLFALLIIVLIILGSIKYSNMPVAPAAESFALGKAFGAGFIEGYNTLDAIAAVAFCIIAMNTLKQLGFTSKKEYLSAVWVVGIVTAIFFSVLYIGLSYLGNHFPIPEMVAKDETINKGAYILSEASKGVFGNYGQIFLGIMVVLTCFTTTVGLIVSVSEFFVKLYNKISYEIYVIFFTTVGFLIANIGLNNVITYSVPVLLILYPIVITMVLFTAINKFIALSKKGMQFTMAIVTLLSIVTVLAKTFNVSSVMNLLALLPFNEQSLGWLVPCLLGLLLSLILPNKQRGEVFDFDTFNK